MKRHGQLFLQLTLLHMHFSDAKCMGGECLNSVTQNSQVLSGITVVLVFFIQITCCFTIASYPCWILIIIYVKLYFPHQQDRFVYNVFTVKCSLTQIKIIIQSQMFLNTISTVMFFPNVSLISHQLCMKRYFVQHILYSR